MDYLGIRNVLVAVAATVAVSACAGGGDKRSDAEQQAIARANDSIKEAESAGAYEQASADLNRAREKVKAAEEAARKGDDQIAERLAVEASLDAQVASATASNQEMQSALTKLQDSIKALQDEIRRNEQRDQGRL